MKKTSATLLMLALLFAASCRENKTEDESKDYTTIEAAGEPEVSVMTAAPMVPPPIGDRAAKKVIVNLECTEIEGILADSTRYKFWTFNDIVPGSFIRIRVGDEVQLNIKNAANSVMPHNIDLHAVNGPGGGAEATFVAPGKEVTFHFKALNPGLYIYHCAAPPVPLHIANGMYGLILVEPEGGLPKVDKEFYIMQSEFYTKGAYGTPGLQEFDNDKGNAENPDYVLFNGRKGSMLGKNMLQANVGETVRFFVGNAGPNLTSSFHLIGEIFDKVYIEGGSTINRNVQTTVIPAGGATIVEFKVTVPGVYNIVDHSIFRAFNKGAIGQLKVTGDENPQVYGHGNLPTSKK